MQLLDLQRSLPEAEQRVILNGVTWQQYDTLVSLFMDQFPALRMTYLEGTLEIMSTSPEHERLKTVIARLIEIYAVERRIRLNGYGSATFRREAAERGLEPDECYCLGVLREVPEIAIEIVITSGGLDKLEVYRGLGVQEVWLWRNQQLCFYALQQPASTYLASDRSQLLPELDPTLLASYVGETNQTKAVKAYRDALQQAT